MLATSIAPQCLEAVARRNAQVIELPCGVDRQKLGPRPALNLVREIPDRMPTNSAAVRLSAKLLIIANVPKSGTHCQCVRPVKRYGLSPMDRLRLRRDRVLCRLNGLGCTGGRVFQCEANLDRVLMTADLGNRLE